MEFSKLNLNPLLFKGIEEASYKDCTGVQEKVLSLLPEKKDLFVQSQTGTGKTAAFLVTIMEQLLDSANSGKKALILVPTRELAFQVEEEAKKIGKYTSLKIASFFGGVGYDKQLDSIKKGVDIFIATPGRIIDLKESKKLDLSSVGFLAIDEADRMFDMGFFPDLRKIIKFLPDSSKRQTLLFSATLNSYVKNLAWEYTKDPLEITVEAQNITVDEIDQELIHVSSEKKIPCLLKILEKFNPSNLIIFCNTKKMCEILSKRLSINGISNDFLIGDLPQKARLKIMDNFKSRKTKCLIATDVASRGIDVNNLEMVLNFDIPDEVENYVHRIGRTARAGKKGIAITLCSEQDVYSLMPIERYIEKKIPSRVATEEDYAFDKSKNVYIDLKKDKDSNRTKSLGRNSRKDYKTSGKADKTSSKKQTNKKSGISKNRNSKNSGRTDIENLSSMTSEERMAYYKEKYASKVQKNNGNKNKNKNYKTEKRFADSKNKKNSIPKKQKKSGFFDRIKKLFSK